MDSTFSSNVIKNDSTRAEIPNFDHTTLEDWENVYEPAEDTYLLCDAILRDFKDLSVNLPRIALEIGCGSGCAIIYLASLIKKYKHGCCYFVTDINPKATNLAYRTAIVNQVMLDGVVTRFAHSLKSSLQGQVDVLIFNPPYVPTPNSEVQDGYLNRNGDIIAAAWAGGDRGRVVIDQFLPTIQIYLSPGGRCYLVLVEENDPHDIKQILSKDGLICSILLKRRAKNERLMIMKIVKPR